MQKPWQIKNVSRETRQKIKAYAAKHDISLAEALALAAKLLERKAELEG